MKKKTSKLRKLEQKRYSIATNDLNYCYICGMPKTALHEVFYGNNRVNSMKYGCVVPLCNGCHTRIHNDIMLDLQIKRKIEKIYLKHYVCSTDDFIKIFHINYI